MNGNDGIAGPRISPDNVLAHSCKLSRPQLLYNWMFDLTIPGRLAMAHAPWRLTGICVEYCARYVQYHRGRLPIPNCGGVARQNSCRKKIWAAGKVFARVAIPRDVAATILPVTFS